LLLCNVSEIIFLNGEISPNLVKINRPQKTFRKKLIFFQRGGCCQGDDHLGHGGEEGDEESGRQAEDAAVGQKVGQEGGQGGRQRPRSRESTLRSVQVPILPISA
jgi:hypothetical protein